MWIFGGQHTRVVNSRRILLTFLHVSQGIIHWFGDFYIYVFINTNYTFVGGRFNLLRYKHLDFLMLICFLILKVTAPHICVCMCWNKSFLTFQKAFNIKMASPRRGSFGEPQNRILWQTISHILNRHSASRCREFVRVCRELISVHNSSHTESRNMASLRSGVFHVRTLCFWGEKIYGISSMNMASLWSGIAGA